jgi:hypothetical protein
LRDRPLRGQNGPFRRENNMKKRLIVAAAALAAAAIGAALAVDTPPADASDALRAALAESKSSGKGLTFYVRGASIPGVVTDVGPRYVTAKSQAQGHIVIRIDSIDALAGHIAAGK